MEKPIISCHQAAELSQTYAEHLRREERSANTISKYVRDVRAFLTFLSGRALSKEAVLSWKEYLAGGHAPSSVNSMLAALNSFLDWAGHAQLKAKPLKIQKSIYCKPETELTRAEYVRLVHAAQRGKNHRLALLLQTICATGIRVSELRFITAEAVHTGRALVDCKGKSRMVFLPRLLCQALRTYCRGLGIRSGAIFCTKTGVPLDRSNIWRAMKRLCQSALVNPAKVFPHNLRHLFARTFYKLEKDISRLADLLGHSSINTTRIYTMESGREHAKCLERMCLMV